MNEQGWREEGRERDCTLPPQAFCFWAQGQREGYVLIVLLSPPLPLISPACPDPLQNPTVYIHYI